MEGKREPTVSILPAGASIGPYTVEELLGVGGSTLVYRTLDTRLSRQVALKVLAAGTVTPGLQRRFIEEAKNAALLNHPNVAVIYEVGDAGGTCFIAMEYVEGETLRRRLRTPGASLPELLGLLRQAAQAMVKAHAKGIVHCDLKPENIMVTREGQVKVLDFGLARLIARYTSGKVETAEEPAAPQREIPRLLSPRLVEGTLGYMSPEQAEGKQDLDERSDIFSFGCILFEAAARRLPFTGDSDAEALYRLRHEPAPDLRRLCPGAPAGLARIVAWCLEKNPQRRCPDMEVVERSLGELLEEGGVPGKRGIGRRRWAAMAVTAAVAAVAAAIGYLRPRPAQEAPSVAVIPFVTARGSAEHEYLSDGICVGLINALAQVPGLKVIARSSSFSFRGKQTGVREIARELGVGALVTGSVAESAGRVRIAVELVSRDAVQLWGMQYNSLVSDLAGLEAEISSQIARRIGARLTEMERARLARATRINPEAYGLLLRARYHLRLYTPESRQKAAAYYEQALAIDPGYAQAHAELAHLYRLLSGSADMSPGETIPKAEAAAKRALAADPDLAEAHAVMADIRKDRWEWSEAEKAYRRALDLNPNLVMAHQGYAIYLGVAGRHDQALREIQRALELDPLDLVVAVHAGAVHYNARRYSAALEALQHAATLDPAAPSPWMWTGMASGASGRYAQAVEAFEKAVDLGDTSPATQCFYSFALARAGRREDALRVLDRMRKSGGFVPPSSLAIAHLGLHQREEAMRALQAAYAARDPMLQYLNVESFFDELAADPRFRGLADAIGLPR